MFIFAMLENITIINKQRLINSPRVAFNSYRKKIVSPVVTQPHQNVIPSERKRVCLQVEICLRSDGIAF